MTGLTADYASDGAEMVTLHLNALVPTRYKSPDKFTDCMTSKLYVALNTIKRDMHKLAAGCPYSFLADRT